MHVSSALNTGALPRRCRPQVIRIGTTVRFILKAPYLGGLTGARPHLGSSACQEQGSQKLLKGRQFRHLVDTSHREFQSKWLCKEITTSEALSEFYGTPVYFGTSALPLYFADLLTWGRSGCRTPTTQQQTTQQTTQKSRLHTQSEAGVTPLSCMVRD